MFFEFHHFERGLSLLKRRHYYLVIKLTASFTILFTSSLYLANRIHTDYEFRFKVKQRYPKIIEFYYDYYEGQGYPMRDLDNLRLKYEQYHK
ncbi:hypothetical protein LOD99_11736 [Oopsacas minuta]|uniref:Uncharacterized protein n=1 Tax=Oopsacas minuta TaxID=111878 RepID=A0AAV7JLX7_9METZ|nr:hypothetical protein LOD99_11736 [Oopsacas minuta]